MHEWSELFLLSLSAFLAATILPAQSEIVLLGMVMTEQYNKWLLVTVATLGNVLGAIVNWFLGCYLMRFQGSKWFPISRRNVNKAMNFYHKYGAWTLLFSWVPVIGDPLTLVAGIFRINLLLFIVLVSIGKCIRYLGIVIIV